MFQVTITPVDGAPGTYTFNITETQNAPNSAWLYDNHTYQVGFTVTDEDGQLTIADPVTTSGSDTFTNSYTASMGFDDEAGGILFGKTLNGRALTQTRHSPLVISRLQLREPTPLL